MRAGDLILAGEVPRAIWAYEHAGRGTAGWAAAERVIREHARFAPTAVSEQAIQAVLGHARDIVQVGNNYRQAGANYVPNVANVPDLRRLEERALHPPAVGPSGRRESVFWNHGTVQVTDATGRVVQQFSVTVPSDGILSRADLEATLNQAGQPFFERFINYDRTRLSDPQYQLNYEIRIGGVYRGY